MKKLFLFIALYMTVLNLQANNIPGAEPTNCNNQFTNLPAELSTLSPEKLLTASPSEFKKMTGRKMSIKEVFALKSAQKAAKKSMRAAEGHGDHQMSQLAALLLALFLGFWGVHRFYLGYPLIGIIQILTLGGCGIWWIIDTALIAVGALGPKDGSGYDITL